VEIHIATAAVVRGEMEYDADPPNSSRDDTRVVEIGMNELNEPFLHMAPNVVQPSAREVVDDPHARTA
jgi:hypothetical protein